MNKILTASAFKSSRIQLLSGLLAAIAIIILPDMVNGQNDTQRLVINAPEEVRESSSRKLNKIISVELNNVPLEEALQFVADKEELELVYSKNLVLADWNRNISVWFPEATVLGALYGILEKSGRDDLRLVLSDKNHLVIVQNGSGMDGETIEAFLPARQQESTEPGTIYGEIREAGTGEPLQGANVIIKGTSTGAAADVDGRFMLRRVSPGNITLEFRYLGFVTKEVEITLPGGESVEVNVELMGDFIQGDEIYVVARQRGQSRALTRQRESVNIRTVVSAEQMDRFADVTVEGSLQRIAGMGHGGANIRGIGAGASNITMDGQRMGATGSGDRSVDLSTISADMVQELEVIKVITPNMDADALSGVININTRRPVGGERSLNARLGGGWNSRFLGHVGPTTRASLSYGDSPSDDYSYSVNFSYQRDTPSNESVRTDWGFRNFEDIEGMSTVLSDLRSSIVFDPRDRYGSGFQFTFQPSVRTTYHIQANFNYQKSAREEHTQRISPVFDRYINPYETRDEQSQRPGNAGDMFYNTQLRDRNVHQYTMQAGGRHLFSRFNMEYKLGWGHGRSIEDRYNVDFRAGNRYAYRVSYDEGQYQPTLETTIYGARPDWPTPFHFESQDPDQRWSRHVDNEFRGVVDFDIPFSRGSFKLGSSALLTFKEGLSERYQTTFERNLRLEDFDPHMKSDFRIFDRPHQTYHIPYIVDLHKIRDWYYSMRPHFDMNMESWAIEAETSFYTAHEHTFGAYGMGEINISRFKFLFGARLEHTDTRYDGRDGTIGDEGEFRGAVDATAKNSYTNIFPNAQVVYALGMLTNVRLAYSRSIGRPTLTQLSPYVLRNYASERLNLGNPQLQPMLSNNLDLLFEHYFMNVGQFTFGLYYKSLRDFVFQFSDIIGVDGLDGEGEFVGWRRSTFRNGESATVYGAEISWQQHLEFLPGFLGNLGTYANYSYAYSETDLDRPEKSRLQNQRPHVVNVGLDYTQGRFSAQTSYAWASPSVTSYGERTFIPGFVWVYYDQYRDAANELSMTLRFRLTDSFRLWADATNILNNRSVSYFHDQDLFPYVQSLSGRTVYMGIRYTL